MIARSVLRQVHRRSANTLAQSRQHARRTVVAAPRPNSGPLMERRADRELPEIPSSTRWVRHAAIFIVAMAGCSLAIFNYQKSTSSVVASTLYALRKHPEARELLGDEIYFAQQIPWIWGTINQLHGHIDIQFRVKGTKDRAMMRFHSERHSKRGYFNTVDWTLKLDDGKTISLMQGDEIVPFPQDETSAVSA